MRFRLENEPLRQDEVEHLRKMKELSQKIRQSLPAVKEKETILYPASGSDSATGFLLFPNAKTVVGFDNHPFVEVSPDGYKRSFEDPIQTNTNLSPWSHFRGLDNDVEMAPNILGALLASIPGIRILSVKAFVSDKKTVEVDEEPYYQSHGEVIFDTGNGTPTRRYIHINDEVTGSDATLISMLSGMQFDGVIAKAAMNLFRDSDTMKNFVLGQLARNRGVLLEGENFNPRIQSVRPIPINWEVTDTRPIPNTRTVTLENVPYGYNNNLHAIEFGK